MKFILVFSLCFLISCKSDKTSIYENSFDIKNSTLKLKKALSIKLEKKTRSDGKVYYRTKNDFHWNNKDYGSLMLVEITKKEIDYYDLKDNIGKYPAGSGFKSNEPKGAFNCKGKYLVGLAWKNENKYEVICVNPIH